MLRSFRVTNHRALAATQELRPTGSRTGALPAPVTAVYGAAATGKSSLVGALGQMRDAVLHSVDGWDPYAGPVRAPHRGFADEPSEFVATFVAEGVPYTYGFRLDNADVTAEWLHSHPRHRKRVVFEREGEAVRIGSMFEPARYGLGPLVGLMRPNALLLSLAGRIPAEALTPAYRWFDAKLEVQCGQPDSEAIALRLGGHASRSTDNAARLLTLLRSADLGIEDLLIAENDPLYADHLRGLDDDIDAAARALDASAASPAHADQLRQTHGLTPVDLERDLHNLRAARDTLYSRMVSRRGAGLGLVHEGVDAAFDLADESTATLSLLRLLPPLLEALDTGRVLVVDDLDSHLTTVDRLIRLFRTPESNPRGAQLIFTTHDRDLVDRVARSGRGHGRAASRRSAVRQLHRTSHGTCELGSD